jgi:hypothetical protein
MFYIPQRPSTVAKRLARHFTCGRSRVLTPVPPDQVWVFFKSFPTPSHRGMSHITDKANAGSESTIHTVPIPNLPVSVAEKALESLLCYLFSTFFTVMFFQLFSIHYWSPCTFHKNVTSTTTTKSRINTS